MAAPFLELHLITRTARSLILPQVRDAIVASGGWVTGYQEFSNKTVCLGLELDGDSRGRLLQALAMLDCVIDEASAAQLELPQGMGMAATCRGTLVVTLLHGEADERSPVLAVPG